MDITLFRISLLCYTLSSAGYLLYLGYQRDKVAVFATWTAGGGFLVQSLFLVVRGIMAGHQSTPVGGKSGHLSIKIIDQVLELSQV